MIDQYRGAIQYFLRLALCALRPALCAPRLSPRAPRLALCAPRLSPRAPRLALCVIGLFLGTGLSAAYGDMREHLSKLHPYISVQGLYDDNLYLTQDNKTSDFITTVSPGLKYKTQGAAYNFDLGFDLGMNFYASNPDLNYISYNGRLNTSYSITPRWTVKLDDTITRSRDNLQSYSLSSPGGPQTYTASSTGQGIYLRNIFQPSLEYKFGRENVTSLSYRNMVYRTEGSSSSGDSLENAITPRLAYWFDIRNGISLDYTYTNAGFENQPDWVGSSLGGRYLYRLNPRTTAYGDYRYTLRDFEPPGRDYSVHSPTLGVDHAFSPSLTSKAQFGWFWQVVDAGPSFNGPVINLSVTQRVQRTSYTLAFDSGYREQFFTTDNLGFSRYYQATAGVTHKLRERLSVGLTGSLSRDEYAQPDRIDYLYRITGNLSYQPLKWLTASLEAGNSGRESEQNGNNYRDNRVMLKLTAEY
jgi:hypothetical protein